MFIQRVRWALLAFIIIAVPVLGGVGSFGADAHAASSRVAVIKELKGTVKVKKAGGAKEFTAFARMSLNQGDILSAGAGSSAVLQFANGTDEDDKMTVSANTKLSFSKLSNRKGTTTKVSMWSGSAWIDVKSIASANDEFMLETPTAVMGVRGTHLLVSVDPTTGNTRLTVAAGVVRTETTDSAGRQAEDVYPTQRALITDADEEKPGDIYIAPVDLSLLMGQSDSIIVSAILGSAADIVDENARYAKKYTQEGLPEQLGESSTDLDRFKTNTASLLGAIADQALKNGLLTQERLDRIVAEVKEQSGLTIDLSKNQLEISEAEKKRQEEQRKLEAVLKQQAEVRRQKELKQRSALEELQRRLEEAKKKLAEANKKAKDEKKKKATEAYENGLSDAEKEKYEQEKKKREAELAEPSPSPAPSPSYSSSSSNSQTNRSNVATLSDLKINGTTLTGFNASTTDYSLAVSHETEEVTVSPNVTTGSNATVKVGGVDVASGSATGVSLASAGNPTVIEIVVTAENGINKTTYKITVNREAVPVNLPPIADAVSGLIVNQGETLTGTLTGSDPDAGDVLTFMLVTGPSFGTVTVAPNGGFSYTPIANYSGADEFTFKVYDGITYSGSASVIINVMYVNQPPSDIVLSYPYVDEGVPVGTIVSGITAADPDNAPPFVYELVSGEGADDNDSFSVYYDTDNQYYQLTVNSPIDYETKSTYRIRLKATDSQGASFEKALEVHVNNVNERPIANEVSGVTVNQGETLTGTLTGSDPDAGDVLTFMLVTGPSFGTVTVAPNGGFSYTPIANYSGADEFTFKVFDGTTYSGVASITINVMPVNIAPTDITLSNAIVVENSGIGSIVGSFGATDSNSGDTFTYELVSGTGDDDNGSFFIVGADLATGTTVNYESKNLYSIRVRVTDSGGLTYDKDFEIQVSDVDESPTNIAFENVAFFDYTASSTAIGNLIPTGGEGEIVYSFSEGAGDEDNALFQLFGTHLGTSSEYDDGLKGTYHIRLKATDANGDDYEKSLTISPTKLLTYVEIQSYGGADNVTSSVYLPEIAPASFVKVNGREYVAIMRTASTGNAFAMRADMSNPGTLYLNGTPLTPIGIWYQFGLSAGWNQLLASVPDGEGVLREYTLYVWVGDTPPASVALVDLTAEDDTETALYPVADGTNPFLWKAQVSDPSAIFVDISGQFADSNTKISKVVLANGQYAEEAGTMLNGFRIPYSGTATNAYIHVVDTDGKPYIYKLVIEPASL